MAITILNSSTCSICGEVLKVHQDLVEWSAFLPKGHVLWEYSDTAMHKVCFNQWEHKETFNQLYQYQPLIDFEDPDLQAQIQKHGLPDWLKAIKAYRANQSLSDDC